MPKFKVITPVKRNGKSYQPGDELEMPAKAAEAIPWAVKRVGAGRKPKDKAAEDSGPTDAGQAGAAK